MGTSTPQGPGPQLGSDADASPVDEERAVEEAMDEEPARPARERDDGVIDISVLECPEVSGGDDVE